MFEMEMQGDYKDKSSADHIIEGYIQGYSSTIYAAGTDTVSILEPRTVI